jgi:hypothetical protein
VHHIAMRDEDQSTSQQQMPRVCKKRIVIARKQRQPDVVLFAEIEQAHDLSGRDGPVVWVMHFADIAIDHKMIKSLPERSQRVSGFRGSARPAKMQIRQNQRAQSVTFQEERSSSWL